MSTSRIRRSRSERLAALGARPGGAARAWDTVRQPGTMLRIALCMLSILLLWLVASGWRQPFSYRRGEVRPRDLVARVKFSVIDEERTARTREQRIRETPLFYRNDAQALVELRETTRSRISELMQIESFEQLPADARAELGLIESSPRQEPAAAFAALKAALGTVDGMTRLEAILTRLFTDWEHNGILDRLDDRHTPEKGSQTEIRVYPDGKPELVTRVEVDSVRLSRILPLMERRLIDDWRESKMDGDPGSTYAARWIADYVRRRLKPTLTYDESFSVKAREEVEAKVAANPELITYEPGKSVLARGRRPLDTKELELLRSEHEALMAQTPLLPTVLYSLATFGLFMAMFVLCGYYVAVRKSRLLVDLRQFVMLLLAILTTVAAGRMFAIDNWRAELVPLILFAMTITIVHRQELALLLSAATALAMTLAFGFGLANFVVYSASMAAAILLLGRIRSRTRLIHIGTLVGLVSFLTSVGVCTLVGQAFGSPTILASPTPYSTEVPYTQFISRLFAGAAWEGTCGVMAGLLMTALLPFIERLFDIQTDIKLLELGDAAHPLLQELVRRAPGTYNHSINVASMGEAAAEAIGANGLLVRVGAYFHDIGKMLKPNYFIENQGQDGNRHSSLVPAMSTLVIIAHVKDGANLARQHRLPQSIVDFIEQHHGTTLVEYFYRQATRQSEADPDGAEVDEASFRYPGPKPQTKEAGVLMLADAVEGASRTLVDPTPARIENLVHEIAMKRLLDGQYEECGLTLQQLHTIEESLVKSLTAVYHGRVKYPDQQSA